MGEKIDRSKARPGKGRGAKTREPRGDTRRAPSCAPSPSPKEPIPGCAAQGSVTGGPDALSMPPQGVGPLSAAAKRIARFRVPEGAPEEVAKLADRALQRLEDVMEERVEGALAGHVRQAAVAIREEICGPVPRDINVKGQLSLQDLVRAATVPEVVAPTFAAVVGAVVDSEIEDLIETGPSEGDEGDEGDE